MKKVENKVPQINFVKFPPAGAGSSRGYTNLPREEWVEMIYRAIEDLYPHLPEIMDMLVNLVPKRELPLYVTDDEIPMFIRIVMIKRLKRGG